MGSNNKMKTVFVFLTILASALCATLPCGHNYVIKPVIHIIKPVIHKVHASSCFSIHRKAHYIPFYYGCKGGKTPTPVINPILPSPVITNPRPVLPAPVDPIVSNPRPVLPAPVQGGRAFTPIVGGGGGLNELFAQR